MHKPQPIPKASFGYEIDLLRGWPQRFLLRGCYFAMKADLKARAQIHQFQRNYSRCSVSDTLALFVFLLGCP